MTTIAANRECMAGDTRVVTGGSFYHADKVFRVGTSLLGTAGDGFPCLAFLEWFKSAKRNPGSLHKMFQDHDRDDVLCIELRPGGIYLWNGWGFAERINDPFYAIGSGAMAAIEAMRHGATPEEAVKRSLTHDECTGGPIQTEYLLPPELLPKRRRRKG